MKAYFKVVTLVSLISIAFFSSCDEEDAVTPVNRLVAVAGDDQSAKINDEIGLDASASRDGNNKPFTFSWTLKTKPQGSNASIPAPQSVKTTFVPDVAGVYVIRLTLSQSTWSAADELTITVAALEPEGPQTIVINEDITTNTTLGDLFEDPSQIDYLVTENVDVRAELTVMPGVVIAFAENKGMQIISGFISAKGTANKGILLKGSNNGEGYWKGLVVFSNSELNEFEYVTIKQGGSAVFFETGVRANVTIAGSAYAGGALRVNHTAFEQSGGYGLYVQGASSLNAFTSNSFSINASADVYLPASQLHKIDPDNWVGNIGLVKVETAGATLTDEPVTWKNIPNGSYLVTGDIDIRGGVTIEAGASFKMKSGTTINVTDNGFLKAVGTTAAPITFTSTAANVYWNGIYLDTYQQNNQLAYSEISNAGLNKIAGADHAGNVVLGYSSLLTIEHSILKNGLGYGLVAKAINQVNENIIAINTFSSLEKGSVFPDMAPAPERPELIGTWMDEWSTHQRFSAIRDDFYNKQTGIWFGGADSPWTTYSDKGMGIRFNEDGSFIWLIAERLPMTVPLNKANMMPPGCISYSAEYITGSTTVTDKHITFHQDYWRSKFVNSCDPTQNVDMSVQPSNIPLRYEFHKLYDLFTGEPFWELKFLNPDNSSFSFYRR